MMLNAPLTGVVRPLSSLGNSKAAIPLESGIIVGIIIFIILVYIILKRILKRKKRKKS